MKKLLLLLVLLVPSLAEAQVMSLSRSAIMNVNTQTSQTYSLIGSGVFVHRMFWNVTGSITSGSCGVESSVNASTWTNLIPAQSMIATGGPTSNVTGVVNYIRFNCNSTLVGSGTVYLVWVGDTTNFTGTSVSVTNTPLDVNIVGGSTGNGAASNTGSAVPAQGDYSALNVGGTLRGQTGINPSGSIYAAQTDITSVNGATVLTGNGTATNALRVVVANDNSAQAVSQSGTWTIQPGNTPNSTPWLTTISQGGNSATVSAGGALKVDNTGSVQPISGTITANQGGNWPVRLQDGSGNSITSTASAIDVNIKSGATVGYAQGSTTSGQLGGLTQAAVTTAAPTYTTGQTSPLSLDTTGQLRVTGGGFSGNTGSAVPTQAGYNGLNISGTLRGQTGINPSGVIYAAHNDITTINSIVPPQGNGVNTNALRVAIASDNSAFPIKLQDGSGTAITSTASALDVNVKTNAGNFAQGSTTSGQSGPLMQGAVTTAAPTYTTAQTSPLSLDTTGALRVNVVSGSTGNAAASATGSAVPAQAGYTGVNVGGTLRGVTATNTSGSVYALDVNIVAGGGTGGTSSSFGAAFPATGTAIGGSDGTNMQGLRAFDVDTGGGTQYALGVNLRKAASGGSVEAGTSTDPLRVDPTGTTTQPVSGTITANAGTGLNLAQGSTTSGQTGLLMQGAVTTSAPTYTTAQTSPLSLDTTGALRVNVTAGGGSGADIGTTGSAVPASASYQGLNVAGNLRGATAVNPTGTVYAQQMDLASIAGTVTPTGNGTAAGSLRVSVASDSTGVLSSKTLDGSGTSISSTANALYGIIRDAAGNARGANVNASNQLSVSVDNAALTVQPGNTPNTTAWLVNQDAAKSVTTTMQNAAVANGNGTVLAVDGQAVAHLTVNCTVACSGGTQVVVEGQNDGTNFTAMMTIQDGSNTITSTGTYTLGTGFIGLTVPIHGQKQIRARIANYSAGTITVTGTTSPAAGNPPPVINANIVTSNQSTNITQLGGTTVDTNSGVKSAGTLRVVIATDQPQLTNKLLVTPDANSSVNVAQIGGGSVVTVGTGVQKVAIADTSGNAISASSDPCSGAGATPFNVNFASTTAQLLVSATSAQTGYICSIHVQGNTTSDEVVNIIDGTQTTNPCDSGTPTALDGSTTAANGLRIAASGGGYVLGNGGATVYKTSATNRQICAVTSGSNRITVSGMFVKQ